ncbi:hypothetical protein HDV04_000832 [Boothiomyces sp. JEL0838]|nr:hypothetical protein HDV04_001824 [Boothiomyces sp. JEL0838]KAJ3308736.1 hypothetical protein HDV04_000832 [Boothiomyces sp. JEL0838]
MDEIKNKRIQTLIDRLEKAKTIFQEAEMEKEEISEQPLTATSMLNPLEITEEKQKKINEFLGTAQEVVQPRYFDPDQEEQIICRFCRKPGHTFKSCKEKETRCYLCKSDHDPVKCPLADICFHCFYRGHCRQDCKDRRSKYCEYCRKSGHSTMECEKTWRQYIYNTKDPQGPITVSCYNCGSEDHFGDYCQRRGSGYHPPTAFDFDDIDINKLNKKKRYYSSDEDDYRRKSFPTAQKKKKEWRSSGGKRW